MMATHNAVPTPSSSGVLGVIASDDDVIGGKQRQTQIKTRNHNKMKFVSSNMFALIVCVLVCSCNAFDIPKNPSSSPSDISSHININNINNNEMSLVLPHDTYPGFSIKKIQNHTNNEQQQ